MMTLLEKAKAAPVRKKRADITASGRDSRKDNGMKPEPPPGTGIHVHGTGQHFILATPAKDDDDNWLPRDAVALILGVAVGAALSLLGACAMLWWRL